MLVSDNRAPIVPGFCETGGTYPTQLPERAEIAVKSVTDSVLRKFRFHGAFHFECLVRRKTGASRSGGGGDCGGGKETCDMDIDAAAVETAVLEKGKRKRRDVGKEPKAKKQDRGSTKGEIQPAGAATNDPRDAPPRAHESQGHGSCEQEWEIMPIELNARIGGAECPAAIEATTSTSLVLAALDLARGGEGNYRESIYSPISVSDEVRAAKREYRKLQSSLHGTELRAYLLEGQLKRCGAEGADAEQLHEDIVIAMSKGEHIEKQILLAKTRYDTALAAATAATFPFPFPFAPGKVVVSVNFHTGREGELAKLSSDLPVGLELQQLELVDFCLHDSLVGRAVGPGQGSRSCLGWIACRGGSEAEAMSRVQRVLSCVRYRLQGGMEEVPAFR